MAKQSLFSACKRVFRDGISGTYTVGNKDIFLELYSQQDIDQNNEIGNSSEENIVVVAGDTITIPEGYTLTPVKPKKSLVVICNKLVNNGTISMYQKAPNVLPHDLYIVGKREFGGNKDIIIPAYANNQVEIDGTNRSCGTGGKGNDIYWDGWKNLGATTALPGSGYAFGGGAGAGGVIERTSDSGRTSAYVQASVNSEYPMRGGNAVRSNSGWSDYGSASGGIGNPHGTNNYGRGGSSNFVNNFGCGGRIIIFCNSFTNNGIIDVNGTNITISNTSTDACGGASGAGAIDLFYTNIDTQGNMTATGGTGPYSYSKGGDGSITLTPWDKKQVVKPVEKYMSRSNMIFFLNNYVQRLKQED